MKQKLLTDIELDTHELKYLMEGFLKEPTDTLSELLKRNIMGMQKHLTELLQEIENNSGVSPSVALAIAEDAAEKAGSVKEETDVCPDGVHSVVEEQLLQEVRVEEPVAESETFVGETEPIEDSVAESFVVQEKAKPLGLGEALKLSAGSLRRSISLNDSFRFSRELFGGDMQQLNRVVEQISVMNSYQTAVAFLASKVKLDEENEAVNDFLELLKKYFN